MQSTGEPIWTIDELGAAVAAALAQGYDGPPNARVRDVPDRRTIRYYTTLGLLDRAIEMRGRTALYGRRHLLQLVAIKKLQARGLSLAEVQKTLAGQTDAALARLAGLGQGQPEGASGAAPRRAARDFWREAPTPISAPPPENDADERGETHHVRGPAIDEPQVLQGVPLAAEVTLLLRVPRSLDDRDLAAVRTAAAPLIDILTKRRLITPREQGETA
jgi:DNA-binding transcriptional MerR regulator